MDDARLHKGIDRRTIVKAGVATAWAVPLVQVVAAAPAFAAVSGPASLSGASGSITRHDGTYTARISLTNTGGSATQALTATLSFSIAQGNVTASRPAGWTGAVPTWTATEQIAAGGRGSFNVEFTVPPGHADDSVTVTISFTTAGGSAGSVSRTF